MKAGPRILVLGSSGAGKTTFARRASSLLGVRFVELDSIRHGPNWIDLSDEKFRNVVADHVAGDGWVIDGNYSVVRDLTLAWATTVIWLDFPLHVVMRRVIARSVWRTVTGHELWNGNRERWNGFLDPTHPIYWTWSTHGSRRKHFQRLSDERWMRLRSDRDVDRWLAHGWRSSRPLPSLQAGPATPSN